MARALRSRLSPMSMASRYGSQALGPGATAESVITSLAGFEVAFAFPLLERFSGLGLGEGIGKHRKGRFCRARKALAAAHSLLERGLLNRLVRFTPVSMTARWRRFRIGLSIGS